MSLRPEEIQLRYKALPPEYQQGVMPNDVKAMESAIQRADMAAAISHDPNNPAVQMKKTMEESVKNLHNMEQGQIPEIQTGQPAMANRKVFNLKKLAQIPGGTPSSVGQFPQATPTDPYGAQSSPAGVGGEQSYTQQNPLDKNKYNTHEELAKELDSYGDPETTNSFNPDLVQAISGNQTAQDAFDRYFSETNAEKKLELSKLIYENLPNNMKNQQADMSDPSNGMTIQAPFKPASVYFDYLNVVTAAIQEVAEKVGNARRQTKQAVTKTFNLKKIAQHQAEHGVIMWGPGQTRPDPFLRGQPVSDWHILERNKGFGGDIDGYWGVDWEAVWRGNIMDKFSRPYRDTKTGEWVGGYIQKRFEVDKNIPETNNYQLLPGERRRPIMPEYGVTEARLQSMRHDNDGELGRVFNDTSKPFNWRKANSTNKIMTSSVAEEELSVKKKLNKLIEPVRR